MWSCSWGSGAAGAAAADVLARAESSADALRTAVAAKDDALAKAAAVADAQRAVCASKSSRASTSSVQRGRRLAGSQYALSVKGKQQSDQHLQPGQPLIQREARCQHQSGFGIPQHLLLSTSSVARDAFESLASLYEGPISASAMLFRAD